MDRWWEFYKRSIGCIGVLKQWLVRATALAFREESEMLDWKHLERRALSDAKCAQMAADVKDGEDELRYAAEANRERLSRVFGMGDVPRAMQPISQGELSVSQTEKVNTSRKGPQRRVGERVPMRDPVGKIQTTSPSSSTCPFKGIIEISADQMKETGVSLIECPDCARTRTLSPRNGVLRFPSHDKRKTRTPNTDRRWAMGKTTWEVVGG